MSAAFSRQAEAPPSASVKLLQADAEGEGLLWPQHLGADEEQGKA